jgi:hypothetical protein
MTCTHHASCRHGRWETKTTAWMMLGAAGGSGVAVVMLRAGLAEDLMLMVAALPILIASIASTTLSNVGSAAAESTAGAEHELLPVWSDRWPKLVRASIALTGGGAACAAAMWYDHLASGGSRDEWIMPAILLGLGGGALAGRQLMPLGPPSVGGFGVACVIAGIITGVGSVAMVGFGAPESAELLSSVGSPQVEVGAVSAGGQTAPSQGIAWAFTGALGLACLGLGSIGHATSHGNRALLGRVASRSSVGTRMLARMLGWAAVAYWLGVPVLLHSLGGAAALVLLAVVFLALGGTLIAHDAGPAQPAPGHPTSAST